MTALNPFNRFVVEKLETPPGTVLPPREIPSQPPSEPVAPNPIPSVPEPEFHAGAALIGYNNLLSSADTQEQLKALTPNTYERWTSASGLMSGLFQFGNEETIDYVGIGAHNLFTAGVDLVEIYTSATVGGAKTLRDSFRPIGNGAIMRTLEPALTDIAEIEIRINTGENREIGVVYAGQFLRMQRPIYGGHSPIDLSATTRYQSTMSDTGQFLGRTIIREGLESSYTWQHLTPDWYREKFQPFVTSAKRLPFFIKWRPDYYPDAVAFGHTNGDISPSNMGGGHQLMSVSLTMRGHADSLLTDEEFPDFIPDILP